ncbi:MAG: nitrate ABC transporter substrate-binding protein, partial [Actinomycetota bacterium]
MARRATGCGVLLFTGLALAACGGSSSGGGATPSAASTTPATVSAGATPDAAPLPVRKPGEPARRGE